MSACRDVAQAFGSTHSVATVTGLGWAGTNNGDLLHLAANGFDVLVTVDVRMHVEPHTTLAVVTTAGQQQPTGGTPTAHARVLERLPLLDTWPCGSHCRLARELQLRSTS